MDKKIFIEGLLNVLLKEAGTNTELEYINNDIGEYVNVDKIKLIDITADSYNSILRDFAKGYFNLQDKTEEPTIPYSRLKEICECFRDGLIADGSDEAEKFFKNNLTDEEAKELGIEYTQKKYKVVELKMTRTQTSKVRIVCPDDTPSYDYYDYLGDDVDYNLDEEETDDWEVDDWELERENLTSNEVESYYSDEDIWNWEDYKNE